MQTDDKTTRGDLRDWWQPTMPPEERARLLAAWHAGRSCRDCRHWNPSEESEQGACLDEAMNVAGAFVTPEDYTCDRFAGKEPPNA